MRLVLVRHGESVWNKEKRFTGWADVELSHEGVEEYKCQDAERCESGKDRIRNTECCRTTGQEK